MSGGSSARSEKPRYIGAKIGLVAAAVTVAFIPFGLLGASKPVPTDIFISSESPSLISVRALQVQGKDMLPDRWSPSPVAGAAGPATKPQAVAGLRIGRPTTISKPFWPCRHRSLQRAPWSHTPTAPAWFG